MSTDFRTVALTLVPCAATLAAAVHLWHPQDLAPRGASARSASAQQAQQAYQDCRASTRQLDGGDGARALQHRLDPGSVSQSPVWMRQSQAAIEHCLQAGSAASRPVRTAQDGPRPL